MKFEQKEEIIIFFFNILTNYIYDKMKYNDNILINIKEKNKEELLKLIVVL